MQETFVSINHDDINLGSPNSDVAPTFKALLDLPPAKGKTTYEVKD